LTIVHRSTIIRRLVNINIPPSSPTYCCPRNVSVFGYHIQTGVSGNRSASICQSLANFYVKLMANIQVTNMSDWDHSGEFLSGGNESDVKPFECLCSIEDPTPRSDGPYTNYPHNHSLYTGYPLYTPTTLVSTIATEEYTPVSSESLGGDEKQNFEYRCRTFTCTHIIEVNFSPTWIRRVRIFLPNAT